MRDERASAFSSSAKRLPFIQWAPINGHVIDGLASQKKYRVENTGAPPMEKRNIALEAGAL